MIARESRHEIARIVYPQPATIITLDPDIPAELQRVSFVGRFAGDTHEWRLDEKTIGSSASLLWKPERCRHVLSLVDGITPSFFIHSPQRAHPANTFFVDSLRNATERKIIRPPYCLSAPRPLQSPQTKARAMPGESRSQPEGVGRRMHGGDFFIAYSYLPGLCLYVNLSGAEG